MMISARAVSAFFTQVLLLAVLSMTGCSEESSPTGSGLVPSAATVTVKSRNSRLGANLNAVVSTGTQDTFDSKTASEQSLIDLQVVITAAGSFDDGVGNTAAGTNQVQQSSSITAGNTPELMSHFQASGSIAGSISAMSAVSTNIIARSSGQNSFELGFEPKTAPVEIRISGNYSLEGENSFCWVRLNGRDDAGVLLDEEFDNSSASSPIDYSFILPEGERFDFRVSISSATVAYAEDEETISVSGGATFEVNVSFVNPVTP